MTSFVIYHKISLKFDIKHGFFTQQLNSYGKIQYALDVLHVEIS